VLTQTSIQPLSLKLAHLPAYATYLLTHHFDAYVQLQWRLSLEYKLQLMRPFMELPKEQQRTLLHKSARELLTSLAEDKGEEHIRQGIETWTKNLLPFIDKYEVAAEDITKLGFIRKKVLLHFLSGYTADIAQILQIVDDVDTYVMNFELAASGTYVKLMEEKLAAKNHIIEKINNTLPGALYIFDLKQFKNIYTNQTLETVIGYTQQELNNLGEEAVRQLLHPQDQEVYWQHRQRCYTAKDGEILSYKYRVRTKNGAYRWIRNFESVFKRDTEGAAIEMIAISLNIDQEKAVAEQLKNNERLYKQAEKLSNTGSWQWEVESNRLTWTDQLYIIYGLEPQSEAITIDRFLGFVHPDDREVIRRSIEGGFSNDTMDYTFRIITDAGKQKTIRSVGQAMRNEAGVLLNILGTEQDITERQHLIEQLQENEKLYLQAQAIAHLGNWSFDIETNRVSWSKEMYRIFDQPFETEIDYEKYLSILHEEDRKLVIDTITNSLQTLQPYDFLHRIRISDNTIRIIHSRGEVLLKDGKPYRLIGTGQDVTSEQNLIEQLRHSQKLNQQAQSLSQMGNWLMDLKTRKFTWSDEMYVIYEMDKSVQMTEESWYDFVHPDDRSSVKAYHTECIAGKTMYDKIHRLVLRNGKVKTIHRKGEFIYNSLGEAVQMLGTTQDITEQHRVQQELEKGQKFIRKITDATPSIIASYNINTGEYTFVSEGVKSLLGYESREVYEKGLAFFMDVVHPEDLIKIAAENATALEEANNNPEGTEAVQEFTYRMRHKDGAYRWFHTYGTVFDRSSDGKVEHVLNISLDVTAQKEASETIRDQEYFIQQIADASPTVLYLFDVVEENFAYANREIFYVLGYTPEELKAINAEDVYALYHPEDVKLLPERKCSESRFHYSESMMQYECRMLHKAGNWVWLLIREVIFKKDEQGNVKKVLGAALDITKRKEMERTLLQNAFQLEQSNASLEEFAYVASHDLKEPLRKISTFGDRLVATQTERLDDSGKTYLKKVIDASQRMQIMIDDLLSVSMITGNRSFQPHSLQAILEDARQAVEHKLEQKDAVITAQSLPEATIVASQFRQLFQNLLSNSLKFVREGVPPVISITCDYPDAAELSRLNLSGNARYLRLQFRDNGIGFENEFAGKIFQIFQRLHGRSEYEGTGIGLAICKKIVEHHGGIIYASGIPGEGATFTILLPQ
jgi:PAS domain S-box-containing protein